MHRKDQTMRRLLSVGLLLLVGCQTVVGPRKRLFNGEQVDDPRLSTGERPSTGEQMRRARDQLAFPDGSPAVAPRTGSEIPSRSAASR
jgi:hypothetical protein